jgi:hypothetical protein
MRQAKILQPEQAIRRTRKSQPQDGGIYNVVATYKRDITGVQMVVLQNPDDPTDVVQIAEKFIEYLKEAVEIYEENIKPAVEKTKGFLARFVAWVRGIFS